MSTIVGILTFMSMINTTPERLKAGHFFICQYFTVYIVLSSVEHESFYNLYARAEGKLSML